DELGEDDGLAEAGTAEQAGLAAADQRRQQIDNLDAGLERLGLRRQLRKRRRIPMDGAKLGDLDRPAAVDRLAQQVEDAAQRLLAARAFYGSASVGDLPAAPHAGGGAPGDATDSATPRALPNAA